MPSPKSENFSPKARKNILHRNPSRSEAKMRRSWENKQGYIIDWKRYQEYHANRKPAEIENRRIDQAKLEAKRLEMIQVVVQQTLEEEKEMIMDPFGKDGPFIFMDDDKPDTSSVKSLSSSHGSHSDSSRGTTSQPSSPAFGCSSSDSNTVESDSGSSTPSSPSRFGHRMDKPLPRIPIPSMVLRETRPLMITKKSSLRRTDSSVSLNERQKRRQNPDLCSSPPLNVPLPPVPVGHQEIDPPANLKELPVSGKNVPQRIHIIPLLNRRPVSKLDVPEEIDPEFWV